ncbi:MAG: hypothetical protein WBM74_06990 [Polyangiales bacterium]
MSWSVAALLVLAVALVVPAQVRRRRQGRTGNPADRRRTSSKPDTGSTPGPRPSTEPEPSPLKSCPVCLSEYPTRNRFCVRDGAELMDGHCSGPFSQGMICPTCRRGYPFDSSFCPEDADELVPYGLYGAASSTRPPLMLDTHKICPECGIRHAATHLFCGEDGTELVAVN